MDDKGKRSNRCPWARRHSPNKQRVTKPWGLVTCQGGAYSKSIGIARLKTDPCSALWVASWLRFLRKHKLTFYRLFWYGCEQQATVLQETGPPQTVKFISRQVDRNTHGLLHTLWRAHERCNQWNSTVGGHLNTIQKQYMQVVLMALILNCRCLSRRPTLLVYRKYCLYSATLWELSGNTNDEQHKIT